MTVAPFECDFCDELRGGLKNSFCQLYSEDPKSRILFRSSQFAVIPSLGQIMEGYLLMVPVNHFKALCDMAEAGVDELAIIAGSVGEILRRFYGPYILFEHGARSEDAGGCGIYHAHLHATPLCGIQDPGNRLKTSFPYVQLSTLAEIRNKGSLLASYLLYQDSAARLYLFDTGALPSQYMRKVLADALHQPNWNWRTAGREERLLTTIDRLSREFEAIPQVAQKLQTKTNAP